MAAAVAGLVFLVFLGAAYLNQRAPRTTLAECRSESSQETSLSQKAHGHDDGLGNRTHTTQKYNNYHKAPLAISRGGRSEALGRSLCVIRVGIHQW